MKKSIFVFLTATALLIGPASRASAQDVVMNSAETINHRNFKLALFPTVLLNKNDSGSRWGLAGRFGYGFTPSFDIEAKAARFEGLTYFGVEGELWLLRGRNANVSAAVGGHMINVNGGGDSSGIDTTLLISTRPASKLEIYGGLKLAFDSVKDSDRRYTLAHVVPGFEYALSRDLDFLAEFGLALNDSSRSYFSVGLALYLR